MHIENACRGRGYESMLSFFLFQKAYDDGFSRVSDKKTSDKTVLEIAVNAGFPDAKGLYAAFQQYFGMTPNDYRRKIGIHMDANAKNYVPIRLPFQDPFVQRKLEEYSKER